MRRFSRPSCGQPGPPGGTRGPPSPPASPIGKLGPPRGRPHPQETGSARGSTLSSPSPVLYRPDTETSPGRTGNHGARSAPPGLSGAASPRRRRRPCAEGEAAVPAETRPLPAAGRVRSRRCRHGAEAPQPRSASAPCRPPRATRGSAASGESETRGSRRHPAPPLTAPLCIRQRGAAGEAPHGGTADPRAGPSSLRAAEPQQRPHPKPPPARGCVSAPRGGRGGGRCRAAPLAGGGSDVTHMRR